MPSSRSKTTMSLRLAILTAAGDRSFIGGANLQELKDFGPADARRYLTLLSQANTAIRNMPVPVIARINGVCIGAGLEMAVSCDLRIAAAHARLGMPEVALDLPSVVEAALFPRMIGWGRTAWMLYRGDLIDAELAERWGLIEKRADEGRLDAEVEELVERILANGPPVYAPRKRLCAIGNACLSKTESWRVSIRSRKRSRPASPESTSTRH